MEIRTNDRGMVEVEYPEGGGWASAIAILPAAGGYPVALIPAQHQLLVDLLDRAETLDSMDSELSQIRAALSTNGTLKLDIVNGKLEALRSLVQSDLRSQLEAINRKIVDYSTQLAAIEGKTLDYTAQLSTLLARAAELKAAHDDGSSTTLSRLAAIQSSFGLPLPPEVEGWQTLIVLGVDQGGAHGWGLISRWHLPPAGAPDERWLAARKEILWYGEVVGSGAVTDLSERFAGGIDALVERWGVDLVGMDADSEIQIATNYARKHRPDPTSGAKGQVYLFDQVILKGEDFRRSQRTVQGEQVPVFALHRSFGLDAVRNRLYRGLQHFPADLVCTEGDPGNLLYHYRTSKRLDDGQWDQPHDPDHWFHADNFAEVAVLAHLNEPEPKRLVFGGIKRD